MGIASYICTNNKENNIGHLMKFRKTGGIGSAHPAQLMEAKECTFQYWPILYHQPSPANTLNIQLLRVHKRKP